VNNEIAELKKLLESIFGPVSIKQYPLDYTNSNVSGNWISGADYIKELKK
jgi:hypothetical protein